VLISSAGTRCVRFSAQKHCKNNRGDKSVTALPLMVPQNVDGDAAFRGIVRSDHCNWRDASQTRSRRVDRVDGGGKVIEFVNQGFPECAQANNDTDSHECQQKQVLDCHDAPGFSA
jgi:hypothetical protein